MKSKFKATEIWSISWRRWKKWKKCSTSGMFCGWSKEELSGLQFAKRSRTALPLLWEKNPTNFIPAAKKSLNCFFPVKSASQIPRQRSKHLVLLYNHLSPNQLFPTKGKQKIGQYFVASPDLFRHWTIFCLIGANSAASHKFKLPSKICQKSFY